MELVDAEALAGGEYIVFNEAVGHTVAEALAVPVFSCVPTTKRSRSHSVDHGEQSARRSVKAMNSRFETIMSSLVRAEQAALSAVRVAVAAAETFHA